VTFARQYDLQPFHLDEDAARRSSFGGLIASGWHTIAICQRLMVQAYRRDAESGSLGSPGTDQIPLAQARSSGRHPLGDQRGRGDDPITEPARPGCREDARHGP